MRLSLCCMGVLFGLLPALVAGPADLERTLELPTERPGPGARFAILLTGDGGGAELVRTIGDRLAAADIPTVGWDSRAYYKTRRTPDEAAEDLARVMTRYRREWSRPEVVLIGYSRGADVLPFLINRLPETERERIGLVALLGPAHAVDFEIHFGDVLGRAPPKTALPVQPELLKLRGTPLLVLYGENDEASCGSELPADLGDIRSLPGGHHFDRDYPAIIAPILDSITRRSTLPAPRSEGTPSAGS